LPPNADTGVMDSGLASLGRALRDPLAGPGMTEAYLAATALASVARLASNDCRVVMVE
jgi:hypothetical protein